MCIIGICWSPSDKYRHTIHLVYDIREYYKPRGRTRHSVLYRYIIDIIYMYDLADEYWACGDVRFVHTM